MRKLVLPLVLAWFVWLPAHGQSWPRRISNADGSVTQLNQPAQRILSTSVTITGSLLAINAPVIASAADNSGRFFEQWQSVAKSRAVNKLWSAGSVDLEAVYLAQPDLIVVSSTGADSVIDQLTELRTIAPTIVLDYSTQSWQEIALKLGQAAGYEQQAEQTIAAFNVRVQEARQAMDLPHGKANIVSYHGAGVVNAVAREDGAHSRLLKSLGFEIEELAAQWQAGPISHKDFMRTNFENLSYLTGETTFLLAASSTRADDFMHNIILKNLPSVKNQQVYGLGEHSFRIDLFSANEIIEQMLSYFKK
ncbi:Fe2+-enterobactin ABC transporter substrate-binding protein [Agarivorans sp. QJM3NY_25]|uniref:Fe2+-enterobactin ABC transporter substrate-binding protein n=1 Tax=Agarivorans sp. QJM3NY_25 TaxID=3421430 RepID=UPI003D7CB280